MSKEGFKDNWHWLMIITLAILGLIYAVYVLATPSETNLTAECREMCDLVFNNIYDKSTISVDGYSRMDCVDDCIIHFNKNNEGAMKNDC